MRRMPNTAPVNVPELQLISDVATADVQLYTTLGGGYISAERDAL